VSARIKIIALIYIFILAGIIVLADSHGTSYFAFVGLLPFGDKIGHFCLMGMFSLIVNLSLNARTISIWNLRYLLGSLIVLTVVTIEEFSQIFIGGRSFDLGDLLADAAGIFIFGEIARFVTQRYFSENKT
jgi:VanZ family protein